jgi:low affinity Fe/Cu permease
MSNPTDALLDDIQGLEAVDPEKVEEFMRAMTDEIVPRMEKAVEERRLAAAQSRGKPLKY